MSRAIRPLDSGSRDEARRLLRAHRAARTAFRRRSDGDGAELHGQVRRVIDRHHHGITVQGIGNELGIDWRRLVAVARQLVETGAADQVGHEFYPAGKASPRW